VVLTRHKLRHYFEAHPVRVVSSFPLGEIIRDSDAAGKIAKWSVELMGETLTYAPCKATKSQILADFVAEWTDTQLPPPQIQAECWTLYFDGLVMKTDAGAGLLFVSPLGEHMRYAMRLHFPASNNMAEYDALLCGLKITIETGIKRRDVRGYSQLVIDQVMKNASCHDDKMEAYCKAARALEDKFYGIELNHVPRRYNEEADELAKIASGRITVPPNVFARDVAQPSVNLEPSPSSHEDPSGAPSSPTGAETMDEDPSNEAYVLSLLEGNGADKAEAIDTEPAPARGTGTTSTSPGWIEGSSPLTDPRLGASPVWPSRSLSSTESCTSTPRPASCSDAYRSLRGASSFGTYTRACAATTQRRTPSWATVPPELLLAHRGGRRQRDRAHLRRVTVQRPQVQPPCARPADHPRHMVLRRVGAGHRRAFAKSARGLHPPTGCHRQVLQVGRGAPHHESQAEQAVTFFTDIVYHFGVPNSIITDNGSQFTGRKFLESCDKFHIRVDWAAVAHPQTNGQVERANGMILQGLKPRIFDRLNKSGRKWLQELPAVVWSLRTTPSRATGLTPFFLVSARRLSSQHTWNTGHLGFRATTRAPTSEPARTRWTNWTRLALWP
jgi:ribonuclease HI/transposase InsO family protein